MEVTILNFTLKKSEGINKFDLWKNNIRKSGKNKGKVAEIPEAYGVSFQRCLEIIIHEETLTKRIQ